MLNQIQMKKILMLKGLPGSGKSTWAREFVRKNADWKRINKDDLRAMFDDSKWSGKREQFVLATRDALINRCVTDGYNVIVDDTNLNPKHEAKIKELAKELGCEFETKFFDVTINECIKRDLSRPKSVGESVIRKMYNDWLRPKLPQYVGNPKLPAAVIFDIDGTLAHMEGKRGPFDWKCVQEDAVDRHVQSILMLLEASHQYKVIIMSGRDAVCFKETEAWLEANKITYAELHMRAEGNTEKDWIVKKRMFDDVIQRYDVHMIFDDRDQCVRLWRDLGVKCLQVADGDF